MLASKTKYKAVVTTGAKDMAGNVLDQNPSTVGTQEKVWYFTTGRRSRRAPQDGRIPTLFFRAALTHDTATQITVTRICT